MNSRTLSGLLSRGLSRVLSNPGGGGSDGSPFTPLDFGLIDYGDAHGSTLRSRSMVLGDNGKLYAAPYTINLVYEIDPTDDSVNTYTNTIGISATKKFVDGLQHPTNGKAYFPHVYVTDMLTIDTTNPTAVLGEVTIGGAGDFRGIAFSPITGYVYLSRYNGTTSFGLIDTATDTTTGGAAAWPLVQTGEVWTINGTPSASQVTALTRQWGVTYCPNNGKVYGSPMGGDRVAIYDTTTSNGSMSNNTIDGGLPLPTSIYQTSGDYFCKYGGKGIYLDRSAESTNVGHWIYIMPRRGNTILKIDTEADFCYEIPLPQILQDETSARSMSAVLGPDGFIYSTPWSMPYIFRINPANDSISYYDISDIIADPTVFDPTHSPGNGYWTYGESAGDWIYYACGGARKFLKIRVVDEVLTGNILNLAGDRLVRPASDSTTENVFSATTNTYYDVIPIIPSSTARTTTGGYLRTTTGGYVITTTA